MNRFADIDLKSTDLAPISGYWNCKLVSLEEALKPVLKLIDQLDRSIKAAKKYCHYPSEHGLTHDESAAVYLYTMEGGDESFYRMLNETLRMEDRRQIKPWFYYMKLLDTAFNKLPIVKDNVWRGVPGEVSAHFTKNKKITWWSISSCSLSPEVIKDFLASDKTSTLFMIEAKNARNISGYTAFQNEEEVVLGVGTELIVKNNALKHGGLHVVQLKEITDDKEEELSSEMASMNVKPSASTKGTNLSKAAPISTASYSSSQTSYSVPAASASGTTEIKSKKSNTGTYRNNEILREGQTKLVIETETTLVLWHVAEKVHVVVNSQYFIFDRNAN